MTREITIIIVIIVINFILPPIYAAEGTPSAATKAKLEALKQEIASKAAKLKQEVNLKLQNKAFVGNLKTKSANSLTLASVTGSKIVSINQDTIYGSRMKNIKYSFKNLAEEDYIAALGDIDDTGVLTAKKVILLPKPEGQEKLILWGQIISISNKLITMKDKALKSHSLLISQTDVDSLKLDDFVIVTGFLNENQTIETEFIYTIKKK